MVWTASPRWTTGHLLLQTALAILPLAGYYLTGRIVDLLVGRVGRDEGDWLPLVLALGAIWLALGLLGVAATWVSELLQLRFRDHVTRLIQKQSLRLDLAYYEDPRWQDTFHKAQYEGAWRPMQILQALTQLLQSGLFLGAVAVWLFNLAWWLAPVLVLSGLPAFLVRMYFSGRFFALDRSRTALEREGWHIHEVLTRPPAARELRIFGFGEALRERYRRIRARLFDEKKALLSRQAGYDLLGQGVEVAALVALVAWTALRTLAGALTVGALVMYLQAFQRGQAHLRQALTALATLHGHRLFLDYLFAFLDLQPAVKAAVPPMATPAGRQEGFRVQGVSFTYPRQERPALRDMDLHLPFGARIAIVGPNGSGKSTLLRLLARFYDPSEGRILWEGQDLRDLEPDEWRRQMALVFQDFQQYPFSALENIGVSDLERGIDEDRTREAAGLSGAWPAIEALPQGLASPLGNTFSGGAELSGGQWQQVAIARAIYPDRPILILDEPMSAIDPLVEERIYDRLFAMDRERLLLFVTHRLYHLRRADHIIVMDQGMVAEQGTFDELLHAGGLFSAMFQGQRVS